MEERRLAPTVDCHGRASESGASVEFAAFQCGEIAQWGEAFKTAGPERPAQ
jgi:hypothetical protein